MGVVDGFFALIFSENRWGIIFFYYRQGKNGYLYHST
jgi:hypothetical protein